ncbi:MAG: multidrug effflux MFS transporter [Opitutales bacterium]|jgi:DHA1 family bicyclomycin/chloramphenicol resistance-like MFS transporter
MSLAPATPVPAAASGAPADADLKTHGPGLPVLLAFLTALGPFSVDAYLPAFPEIERDLHATPLEVQQTLSAFLICFAFMTLWHGAISDALGRRRVTLVCLLLFALASVGCALSHTIGQLWFFRALQGMTSGAGIVLGRAVVRDLMHGPPAQRLLSHISMMFAVAPAVAPVLGGWLDKFFGWRSLFVLLVAMALVQWLWCWLALPETLPPEKRRPLHPMFLLRSYWLGLTRPAFLAVCAAMTLNFAGYFVYVVSSPKFLLQHLHVKQTDFYVLFVPAVAGMMTGAWLSGRLAGRISPMQTVAWGYTAMGMAALANVILNLTMPPSLPWSIVPIVPYVLGMSLAMPSLSLLALDLFPGQWGLGASCQTFIQTGLNSVTAAILAPLLWGSACDLALGQFGLVAGGLAGTLCFVQLMKRRPAA